MNAKQTTKDVVVVSGLPRSGTSMMMKMLQAGGVPLMVDDLRQPDIDNPNGYLEFDPVKALKKDGDHSWVNNMPGRAIKVVSALLKNLPDSYQYKVIFMRRNLKEVLASQVRMMQNQGDSGARVNPDDLILFEKHLQATLNWLDQQAHMQCLEVDYNALLVEPELALTTVSHFVNMPCDVGEMRSVIDHNLYRNVAHRGQIGDVSQQADS